MLWIQGWPLVTPGTVATSAVLSQLSADPCLNMLPSPQLDVLRD